MTTIQNAMKIICKMEIMIGSRSERRHCRTKSDDAFIMPIAILK